MSTRAARAQRAQAVVAGHLATIERPAFARCYYGCLIIEKTPLRLAGSSA